jgi:hypothetical protein
MGQLPGSVLTFPRLAKSPTQHSPARRTFSRAGGKLAAESADQFLRVGIRLHELETIAKGVPLPDQSANRHQTKRKLKLQSNYLVGISIFNMAASPSSLMSTVRPTTRLLARE